MTDTLQRLADISVLAFVVLSMLAMGMSQSLAAVVSALRDRRTVATALAINFGIAPLLAVLLTRLVPLEPAHAIGLLLLGSAAGAPFLSKLVEIAGGDLACSVALRGLTGREMGLSPRFRSSSAGVA
jgi:BASS family bile acid:Na+ symporter